MSDEGPLKPKSDGDKAELVHRDGAGRFQPGNPGGPGRRKMDPEVLEMLQAATKSAAQKLIDCLQAERAIVVGNGKGAYTEMVPDYELQLKAAEAILNRVHGRPAQNTSIDLDLPNGARAAVIILPGNGERSDDE